MPRFLLLILTILILGALPTEAQVRFKRGAVIEVKV